MKLVAFAACAGMAAVAVCSPASAAIFTLSYTTIADPVEDPAVTVNATIDADADPFTGPGSGIPMSYLPTSIVGTRGNVAFSNLDPDYFYDNFSEFYYPATPGSQQSLGGAPTYLDNGFATLTYNVAGVDYTLSRSNSTFYLETSSHGVGRNILASAFSIMAVTPAAAVPEPAAWALMMLGFGAIGAALRARPAVAPRFL